MGSLRERNGIKEKLQAPPTIAGASATSPWRGAFTRAKSRRRLPIRGWPSLQRPEGLLRGHYSTSSTQTPANTPGRAVSVQYQSIRIGRRRQRQGGESASRTAAAYRAPAAVTYGPQRCKSAGRSPGIRAGCRPARPAQRCHPGAAAALTARPLAAQHPAQKTSAPCPCKARGTAAGSGHLCRRNTATRRVGGQLMRGGTQRIQFCVQLQRMGGWGAQSGPRQSTPAAARV